MSLLGLVVLWFWCLDQDNMADSLEEILSNAHKNGDLIGPPAPKQYAPMQMSGQQEESSARFSDLLPLIAAQALDYATTEAALKNKQNGIAEHNPLPGMQSSLGRAGWGIGETLLAHFLTRNRPKLRNATMTALPMVHSALSMNNAANAQHEDVVDMLLRSRQ